MARRVELLVAMYLDLPTLKGFFVTQKGKVSFVAEYTNQYGALKLPIKTSPLVCKALNYLSNTQWAVAAVSTQGG